MLSHDDDFDFCYVSRKEFHEEICSEAGMLLNRLRSAGITVAINSFGFMQVYLDSTSFNIYLGWEHEGTFYLYFGIPEGIPAEFAKADGTLEISDQTFPLFSQPKQVLKAIYGEGWEKPNPKYSYSKRIQFHKNFNFLISGWPKQTGNEFWDSVYRKNNIPDYPSQYAISLMPELQSGCNILDAGCGNGRDALFFSKHGHHVVGIDGSKTAVMAALETGRDHGLTANFLHVNVYEPSSYGQFIENHRECFDLIYARFFIHAIDYSGEMSFWQIAKSCLKKNGKVYVEARTANDPFRMMGQKISDTESIVGHYRRFIEPATLIRNAENEGFTVEYKVVGQGMAKFRDEDPEVIRCTFSKQQ